jgi:hypothetical protein
MSKRNFPNLEKEVLSQLAKDIAQDKIFISDYLRDPNLIGSVFMPLVLGALQNYSEEEVKDIGFVYEYYDKAMNMSINGYPIFSSCGFVSKADAGRIREKVKQIKKVIEEL